MEAGHGGVSGRYKRYRETAFQYAFLLDLASAAPRTVWATDDRAGKDSMLEGGCQNWIFSPCSRESATRGLSPPPCSRGPLEQRYATRVRGGAILPQDREL